MANLLHSHLPISLRSPALRMRRTTNYSLDGIEIWSWSTGCFVTSLIPAGAVTEKNRTYLHIWWECDQVCPFWKGIFEVYNEMYDDFLSLSPKVALLSVLRGSVKSQKTNLPMLFLSTVCQLITKFCKSEVIPPPPLIGGLIFLMTSCLWRRYRLERETTGTNTLNWGIPGSTIQLQIDYYTD